MIVIVTNELFDRAVEGIYQFSAWYVIIILHQLLCISKFGQGKSWCVMAVQHYCDVKPLETYQ